MITNRTHRPVWAWGLAMVAATTLTLSGCSALDGSGSDNDTPANQTPGASAEAPQPPADQLTVAANDAGHQWASFQDAKLTPGVQTYTGEAGQCTTNFVFTDDDGNIYLGQAAHCSSTGESKDINGCTTSSLPLGTAVEFRDNSTPLTAGDKLGDGTLVYNSWLTMQKAGDSDAAECAHNDLALVKVTSADASAINPSIPHWGGPVGLDSDGVTANEKIYSYGDSSLKLGIKVLSPLQGTTKADDPADNGWSHQLTAKVVPSIPGIPGDSGSAFLNEKGEAIGTLSTLSISWPVVNTIGDIKKELEYARANSGIKGLRLVLGTEKFTPAK